MTDDIRKIVSTALYDHQGWRHDGAPKDECDCCADVIVDAVEKAGYLIVPTGLNKLNVTLDFIDRSTDMLVRYDIPHRDAANRLRELADHLDMVAAKKEGEKHD